MRLGVISDTHGVLPAEVLDVFAGVDRIVHAGDFGSESVLDELGTIAPVIAVRGNTDSCTRAGCLQSLVNFDAGGVRVLVVHRPSDVPRPLPPGVGVVITGHTHVPLVEERDGVLWLNPGSASRGRSGHGHTVALLETAPGRPEARIVALP
jgi:putative phosphoesterase